MPPRILSRLVALLLVPCLLADPVYCIPLATPGGRGCRVRGAFTDQALSVPSRVFSSFQRAIFVGRVRQSLSKLLERFHAPQSLVLRYANPARRVTVAVSDELTPALRDLLWRKVQGRTVEEAIADAVGWYPAARRVLFDSKGKLQAHVRVRMRDRTMSADDPIPEDGVTLSLDLVPPLLLERPRDTFKSVITLIIESLLLAWLSGSLVTSFLTYYGIGPTLDVGGVLVAIVSFALVGGCVSILGFWAAHQLASLIVSPTSESLRERGRPRVFQGLVGAHGKAALWTTLIAAYLLPIAACVQTVSLVLTVQLMVWAYGIAHGILHYENNLDAPPNQRWSIWPSAGGPAWQSGSIGGSSFGGRREPRIGLRNTIRTLELKLEAMFRWATEDRLGLTELSADELASHADIVGLKFDKVVKVTKTMGSHAFNPFPFGMDNFTLEVDEGGHVFPAPVEPYVLCVKLIDGSGVTYQGIEEFRLGGYSRVGDLIFLVNTEDHPEFKKNPSAGSVPSFPTSTIPVNPDDLEAVLALHKGQRLRFSDISKLLGIEAIQSNHWKIAAGMTSLIETGKVTVTRALTSGQPYLFVYDPSPKKSGPAGTATGGPLASIYDLLRKWKLRTLEQIIKTTVPRLEAILFQGVLIAAPMLFAFYLFWNHQPIGVIFAYGVGNAFATYISTPLFVASHPFVHAFKKDTRGPIKHELREITPQDVEELTRRAERYNGEVTFWLTLGMVIGVAVKAAAGLWLRDSTGGALHWFQIAQILPIVLPVLGAWSGLVAAYMDHRDTNRKVYDSGGIAGTPGGPASPDMSRAALINHKAKLFQRNLDSWKLIRDRDMKDVSDAAERSWDWRRQVSNGLNRSNTIYDRDLVKVFGAFLEEIASGDEVVIKRAKAHLDDALARVRFARNMEISPVFSMPIKDWIPGLDERQPLWHFEWSQRVNRRFDLEVDDFLRTMAQELISLEQQKVDQSKMSPSASRLAGTATGEPARFADGGLVDWGQWELVPGHPNLIRRRDQVTITARLDPTTGRYGIDGAGFPPNMFGDGPAQPGRRETTRPSVGTDRGGKKSRETHVLLSDREKEVLSFAAQGLRRKEIASRLQISENTVSQHLANIRDKLDLPAGNNTTQSLVVAARQLGQLDVANELTHATAPSGADTVLSERHRNILSLVAQGLRSKEIIARLGIPGVQTVDQVLLRLSKKFRIPPGKGARIKLIIELQRLGLLPSLTAKPLPTLTSNVDRPADTAPRTGRTPTAGAA